MILNWKAGSGNSGSKYITLPESVDEEVLS